MASPASYGNVSVDVPAKLRTVNQLSCPVPTRGLSVGAQDTGEDAGGGMRQYLAYGHKTRANGV